MRRPYDLVVLGGGTAGLVCSVIAAGIGARVALVERERAFVLASARSGATAPQRLRACSYAMAHPDDGRLVPACVQHSVLDPQENLALRRILPVRA